MQGNAAALGINFSPKLTYADVPGAIRTGILQKDATLHTIEGWVDFAPSRNITPGIPPNYFPPTVAQPGSVGKP